MDRLKHKRTTADRRSQRVSSQIKTSTERLRLSVHVSHRQVSAQIINDATGKTLAYATSSSTMPKGSLSNKAEYVGQEIAKAAKRAKIRHVVFDRSDRLYHGRLKILAEAARKGGLEF